MQTESDLPGTHPAKYATALNKVTTLIRKPAIRLAILITLHISLFATIFVTAFWIRYDFSIPSKVWVQLASVLPYVVGLKLAIFYTLGHFHGWWRYVTFGDLVALLRASGLSMLSLVLLGYLTYDFAPQIPRSVVFLDTVLTILVIGSLRSSWRMIDEVFGETFPGRKRRPAVLIGTDHFTGQLASQINSNQNMPCRVTALLAINGAYRRKATMGGVPVMGCLSDVVTVARKMGATEVLVSAGALDGASLRSLTNQCNSAVLNVRVLPRFEDAMAGTEKIPLRPLNIEDLLRRDPVELDTGEVKKLLQGKRVVVTGAGGSIGSEICRQSLRFHPREMILLGRGENRIHAIYNELKPIADENGVLLHAEIGDITDHARIRRLFKDRQPEIVFHAAAHKHVPLMELHPREAVKNNVFGTKIVASLADQFHVERFVMVSTDKAVNPTSVMGCSKQLAERVVYEYAQSSDTKFAVVRFGNVLGSAGSVVPIFQEQIQKGGPITITDERMTRYFMSIPEASQLVIQAAAQCRGGEIFVLDMGEPIKIVQLAEDLVALSGLTKDSIEFVFTGIRPGEKLYEELYCEEEITITTNHPKVRAAYASDFQKKIELDEILEILKQDDENVLAFLRRFTVSSPGSISREPRHSKTVGSQA